MDTESTATSVNTVVENTQEQMSVGRWFITLLLLSLPFINLILLFVWGFGSDNPRKNYCKAILLFMVIGFIFSLITSLVIFFSFGGLSLFQFF
ncbi:hypothetical protein ACERII_03755 [Evansella sp. AB-rgal1]|uniref:hypothetical protein n=1 Tax=Evansella sp. AB-rgal1 TaxID=3242696 RepID=UPI00359DC964